MDGVTPSTAASAGTRGEGRQDVLAPTRSAARPASQRNSVPSIESIGLDPGFAMAPDM